MKTRSVVLLLLSVALLASTALISSSQEQPRERRTPDIQQLVDRIEKLEARVQQLESRPVIATTTPPVATTVPRYDTVPKLESVPEDWRRFEFNGRPYYIVPLDSNSKSTPR